MSSRAIRRKVQELKKKKLLAKKVVSLADYREITQPTNMKNILVVDDDPMILSALKRVLEVSGGYRVMVAADGIELTDRLESSRFHLCILDVNLPWVDGYELCRLIKSHPTYSFLPLILISSMATQADIDKGFGCGCDEYLVKPFDMNYIVDTVASTLCS